jgi:predicted O-methyltransferase YrrM
MAHEGLKHVVDRDNQHLGGNISVGDPHSYSPTVWQYLIGRFAVKSILDVGAGLGHAALWFHRAGVPAVGIEGLAFNCEHAVFPLVHADLSRGPVLCPVDMVLCVEMVEHLEEQYLEHLLDTLCNGRIIVMTNALPGQGGYHHVNCQPTEYWINHLAKRGCTVSKDDTERIRHLAHAEGAAHLARTGMVLINNPRIT